MPDEAATQLLADPKDADGTAREPLPRAAGNTPETYLELSPESPSLPRPKRPHGGVGRSKRKRSLGGGLRPDEERQEEPSQGAARGPGSLAAEVIEQLAHLIVDAHERDGDTH
jgi:hypothetical protein